MRTPHSWRPAKSWLLQAEKRTDAVLRRCLLMPLWSQCFNGNSRILKWRYCAIFLAIFCGYIPLHRPYKGLTYGRYLQFLSVPESWPLIHDDPKNLHMKIWSKKICLVVSKHGIINFPIDIWDVILLELTNSYFSRLLLHHQPDISHSIPKCVMWILFSNHCVFFSPTVRNSREIQVLNQDDDT